MNLQGEVVRFVLPEMTEQEKAISSRHFWTALVTDSSLVIYRADSGLEVLGLGPGIFISSAVRKSSAKKKVGMTLAEALPQNRRKFSFSRSAGSIKLKTTQRGVISKRTVLVLTDKNGNVELDLSKDNTALLKDICPEIDISPSS